MGLYFMRINHEVSIDERVIVTNLFGDITFSDTLECFEFVDNFLTEHDFAMVHWVINAKRINMSYSNIISVIEATNAKLSGTGGDDRVIPLLVVDDRVYDYLNNEFKNRYIWAKFPKFNTANQATAFLDVISPRH